MRKPQLFLLVAVIYIFLRRNCIGPTGRIGATNLYSLEGLSRQS